MALTGATTVTAAAQNLVSPETQVHAPGQDRLVTGNVTIRGAAQHLRGVAQVELVVKELATDRYWNGSGWQDAFIRVGIGVARPGATATGWSTTLPWEAMSDGRYRARAFARSVDGNGDANGGDQTEFVYKSFHELYDTEVTGPVGPVPAREWISIEGTGSSTVGVALVRVAVRHQESGHYWNGRIGRWQERWVRSDALVDQVGAQQVSWTLIIPPNRARPGTYAARAWVRNSQGANDPYGRGRITFSVTAGGPPVTTTVPPTTTTSLPTTTLPTTTQPTATLVPTTLPPTTTTLPSTTTTLPPTTEPACPDGDLAILVPCSGVLIGSTGDPRADDGSFQSKQDHFRRTEQQLGTNFDVYHNFLQWRDVVSRTWPDAKTQALADDGRLLFTNIKSPTGSPDDWGRIAAGDYDADIRVAANQFKDFGRRTFVTFYHEPEDNIRDAAAGDPAKLQRYLDDYSAAFRQMHDVFDAVGADNVVWVWDMQGWVAGWGDYYLNGLYPGDDVVDWVAWNPYNWHGCENHGNQRRWRDFEDVAAQFYDWLELGGPDRPSLDKPLMLGEWGSEENDGATNSSQTKAEWLDDARRLLPTRFPRLKAVIYFNTEGRRADGTVQFCEWGLDSSPASMAAMARLLNDPVLEARWS
jgi:hypothetical protein